MIMIQSHQKSSKGPALIARYFLHSLALRLTNLHHHHHHSCERLNNRCSVKNQTLFPSSFLALQTLGRNQRQGAGKTVVLDTRDAHRTLPCLESSYLDLVERRHVCTHHSGYHKWCPKVPCYERPWAHTPLVNCPPGKTAPDPTHAAVKGLETAYHPSPRWLRIPSLSLGNDLPKAVA